MPRIGVPLNFSSLSDEMGPYMIHPVHEGVMMRRRRDDVMSQ